MAGPFNTHISNTHTLHTHTSGNTDVHQAHTLYTSMSGNIQYIHRRNHFHKSPFDYLHTYLVNPCSCPPIDHTTHTHTPPQIKNQMPKNESLCRSRPCR